MPWPALRFYTLRWGFIWLVIITVHESRSQSVISAFLLTNKRRPRTESLTALRKPLSKRPFNDMLSTERTLAERGFTRVIGSDESGTGAIAGPIVCCSASIRVSLDEFRGQLQPEEEAILVLVNDSKQLDWDTRHVIYQHVINRPDIYAIAVSVGRHEDIDASGTYTVILNGFRETIESIVRAGEDFGSGISKDSYYSIVDGHKSPSSVSVPSRPMKQADSNVFSVALASIIATETRNTIMLEYAKQYPQYGFERNGGYSTQEHVQAIHVHAPCPIHRKSTKAVKSRGSFGIIGHANRSTDKTLNSLTRRSSIITGLAVATSSILVPWSSRPFPAAAMTTDPKTGIALPDFGEIESSIPTDWSGVDNPFDEDEKNLFSRLDTTSDANFYRDPRFVEHVDQQAVRLMTDYVSSVVLGKDAILDLCTSWTSHITVPTGSGPNDPNAFMPPRVAGLGMNREELAANVVLTERAIQDLNENPILPYESDAFDVVLCQLSIDYLTKPLSVCREMSRVLKSGGSVHIIFSNRLFLQKAVAIWTGADDIDHCYTVGCYLHFCKGDFENVRAMDLSVRKKNGRIVGDPLYVVTATKRR